MAYDQNVTPITALAGSDLSTRQFQFVSFNTSGVLAVTADAAAADGVLLHGGNASGRTSAVASVPGQVCRVLLGASVATPGLYLEVASGKAVTQSSGKIVAKALTAGSSGDIIPALLILQR